MNTLALDLEEARTDRARRWVRQQRNDQSIFPEEATVWLRRAGAGTARPRLARVVALERSPTDAIFVAETLACARGVNRRLGLGTWLVEVYGEEGVDPLYLRVRPRPDEAP